MSRAMQVDDEESILKTLFRVPRARLERLEPGITEVRWGADVSVIVAPEFQAGD